MGGGNRDRVFPVGWAIRVVSGQPVRGRRVHTLYAAAFSSRAEALDAVKRRDNSSPDETLEVVTTLSRLTIDRMFMAPGDVWPLS